MTGTVERKSNNSTALGRFNCRCKFLEVISAALNPDSYFPPSSEFETPKCQSLEKDIIQRWGIQLTTLKTSLRILEINGDVRKSPFGLGEIASPPPVRSPCSPASIPPATISEVTTSPFPSPPRVPTPNPYDRQRGGGASHHLVDGELRDIALQNTYPLMETYA